MNKKYLIIGIIIFILLCVGIYFFVIKKQHFTISDKNIKGKKHTNNKKLAQLRKFRQIQHHKKKLNSLLRAAYLREEKQVDKENVQDTLIGNNYFLPDVNFCKLTFPQNNSNKIFKDKIYVLKNSDSDSGETLVTTFTNDNPLIQRVDLNDIENTFSFKTDMNDIISSLSNKISLDEKMPTRVVNVKKTLNDILNSNTEPDFLLTNLNDKYCGLQFETTKKTFGIYMLNELYSNENNINPNFLDELAQLVNSKKLNFGSGIEKDNPNDTDIWNKVNRDANNSKLNNIHINEEYFIEYINFMKKWGSHFISDVTFGKSVSVWEVFNKDLQNQYSIDYKKRIDLCKEECSKFPNPEKCQNNIKETFEYFENFTSTPTPTPTPNYTPPYYTDFSVGDIVSGLSDELLKNPNLDPVSYNQSNINYNPQNCEVSDWSDWSQCSVTCGGGTQYRTRNIIKEQRYGGNECPDLTEKRNCNTDPCPINCSVTDWSNWSDCSVNCGGGNRTRNRTIITEPKYGGTPCPDLTDTETCNTNPCPINCKVSDWSEWNKCSENCDGGIQTRTRTVITDSAYGGETCPPLSETQDCNTQPCVTCDANFCSNTNYNISYNNYCLKENCIYPYSLNENNGNLFCQLNLDETSKNLMNKDMEYIRKLFKIKQAMYIKNTGDDSSYTSDEVEDSKKLPTMKTVSIFGGLENQRKDIVNTQNNNINIDSDKLMSFITDSSIDKAIKYEYKPIWELLKELYITNCLSDNINEKYIYNLYSLLYTCTGIVADTRYIQDIKTKYINLFANKDLEVEVRFETSQVAIDALKKYNTKYLDIERFNFVPSYNKKLSLGNVEIPLRCNKLLISSNFKLKNESYFGNGYDIKLLMDKIKIGVEPYFTDYMQDKTIHFILIFGITTEKVEDIKVSMITLDIDEKPIDLNFNVNSLKDPNVYYNIFFRNSESDKSEGLQNDIELDIKFSLNIPIKNSNETYLQYFEGKFVLYKDKILLINNPEQTFGNKITNKQFYTPNNLTQIKNFSGITKNGTVNVGKVLNSGKLKTIRIRGILSKYNTEYTETTLRIRIGEEFMKEITITPQSDFLQNGDSVSIINKNKNTNQQDILVRMSTDNNVVGISSENNDNNQKWIIRSINGSNEINDGDIINIISFNRGMQLISNCNNPNKYPREFRPCLDSNKMECGTTVDTSCVAKMNIWPPTPEKIEKAKEQCRILSNDQNKNSCDPSSETYCLADRKCYKKCNLNYHPEIGNATPECSPNCVSDDNPLETGFLGEKNITKWKIQKVNKDGNSKIKKNELVILSSLNEVCGNVYSYLSSSMDNSNVMTSKYFEQIENPKTTPTKIWAITAVAGGDHGCWRANAAVYQQQGWVACGTNIPTKPYLTNGPGDLNHDIGGPDAGLYVKYELIDIDSKTPILTGISTGRSNPDGIGICGSNVVQFIGNCTYNHPAIAGIISQTHGTKGKCGHYQACCVNYTPAYQVKTYINSIALSETRNNGVRTDLTVQLPDSTQIFTLSYNGSAEDLHASCGDDYAQYIVYSKNNINRTASNVIDFFSKGCYEHKDDTITNQIDKGPVSTAKQCVDYANNEDKNVFKLNNGRCYIGDSVNNNYQPKGQNCGNGESAALDIIYERNKNYTYVKKGCFIDKEDRAIPNSKGQVYTVQQCADIANSDGSKVFSLQNGGQCFTGNDINNAIKYGQVSSEECYMNNSEFGNAWKNVVYEKKENEINNRSSQWKIDIYEEREFYLTFDLPANDNTILNDQDDIKISSSTTSNFTLSNLDIDVEVYSPNFISWNNQEYFKHPLWFELTRQSVFSYTFDTNKEINLDTGASIYINSNELMKYFPDKNVSEFSPFPTFLIDNYNIEFWGYASSSDDTNYDIYNKFCKNQEERRTEAIPPKRSTIQTGENGIMLPSINIGGINYYDVIYTDESDPEKPKNIIEIFVPQDSISIAHDACILLQAAYNLEAAYIFSSKTFCPYTKTDKYGVIQKIIPTVNNNKNITTYGCWNKASGCQSDNDCSGTTTDEHINHKDAWYGRGAGWIPDVHCPNRKCSNQQGIGFASWCDNSPTWPWNLKICSSDKDCGKDGEQWGGFCYPKCRDGYHNTACCICTRDSNVDHDEYDRVKYCNQEQGLFHETKSSNILGNSNMYRTVTTKPDNIPADGTGKDGQYSCAADNARVNNLNEVIRNSPQVEAPCKCQNPYTVPGKGNEPVNAVWNILPDRLIWNQTGF